MNDLIKIAVDAMGGDGSPKKVIDGIIFNHKSNQNNFFRIFGNQDQILENIDNKIANAETKLKIILFNFILFPLVIN